MADAFHVGDIVALSFGFFDKSGLGRYEITRVMPDSASGEHQYRVRGQDGHERAVVHHQIKSATTPAAPFGALR